MLRPCGNTVLVFNSPQPLRISDSFIIAVYFTAHSHPITSELYTSMKFYGTITSSFPSGDARIRVEPEEYYSNANFNRNDASCRNSTCDC